MQDDTAAVWRLSSISQVQGQEEWSDRVKAVFDQQGKKWDARVKLEVKQRVADLVVASPTDSLNMHKRSAFDALAQSLEERLNELPKPQP